MSVVSDFFKFVTLVAILMIVVVAIRNPNGISNILGGFSNILGNLRSS